MSPRWMAPRGAVRRGEERSLVQKGAADTRAYEEARFASCLGSARTGAPPRRVLLFHLPPRSRCVAGCPLQSTRPQQPLRRVVVCTLQHLPPPFASLNIPFGPPETTNSFGCTLAIGLLCRCRCCADLLCPPNLLICNPAGECPGTAFYRG